MSSEHADTNSVRIAVVSSDPAFRRMINDQLSAALEERMHQSCDFQIFDGKAPASFLMEPTCALMTFEEDSELKMLSRLASRHPNMLLLALSGNGSVSRAVAAMQAGAHDFIARPVSAESLSDRLTDLIAHHRPAPHAEQHIVTKANARHEVYPANATAPDTNTNNELLRDFEGFIGKSPAMQGVYDQINRIASSKAPVFITGESGTGKEVCAQALHARSNRSNGPFIAINCSAIPAELMESELFGHMRGAFTGATEDRKGAAELADGGTMFLDEIGEMPVDLQAKLLRLIQTGSSRRVGGTKEVSLDIRFVAATNRDPQEEVRAGRFREDLFYRMHVLPIHLPPLRERTGDIMPLAQSFLIQYAREENKNFSLFSVEAESMLQAYRWPGNIRQLQNTIRRLTVMYDGSVAEAEHLPDLLHSDEGYESELNQAISNLREIGTVMAGNIAPFWQQERDIIEGALGHFDGNISRAAAALEISPSTIYRKRMSWAHKEAV
ncbi:sigma-54-dependent transcriptional regulator [Cohaesibacter celericrescens]|uniref:Sigma-54-dependent Fis family transcriptional regulator n=1 Tax=Cohaesibacter celericrescens TaxID=2067669 RepID=A0A2N5XKS7_9HYPH|nr:sigma-54 dependent transcriptional regulator [Cohaesibacter celericrescens]PLW75037.1 sigma-54-dependent Fis family transcriptional regulator [Cohaesibacter celericrescens]